MTYTKIDHENDSLKSRDLGGKLRDLGGHLRDANIRGQDPNHGHVVACQKKQAISCEVINFKAPRPCCPYM